MTARRKSTIFYASVALVTALLLLVVVPLRFIPVGTPSPKAQEFIDKFYEEGWELHNGEMLENKKFNIKIRPGLYTPKYIAVDGKNVRLEFKNNDRLWMNEEAKKLVEHIQAGERSEKTEAPVAPAKPRETAPTDSRHPWMPDEDIGPQPPVPPSRKKP